MPSSLKPPFPRHRRPVISKLASSWKNNALKASDRYSSIMPAHIQAMIDAIDWNDPKYQRAKTVTVGRNCPKFDVDRLKDIQRRVGNHYSYQMIADYYERHGIMTSTGKPWTKGNLAVFYNQFKHWVD